MLFAIINGRKNEAIPHTIGTCLLCEREVFSKCGDINVWHWAHVKNDNCDSWYEPESEWHKNWKHVFGKDHCEVVISKEGVRHIADILTPGHIIIELQNSPIPKSTINQREVFYGEKMIWIINGKHFKQNFSIYKSQLDKDEDYNRRYNPSSPYFGNYDDSLKDILTFNWSNYRRSWAGAGRNTFIDFGDENLFWVKEGMGAKHGKGKQVTKEAFIKKYGGNLRLLETLIENSDKL